MRNPVGLLCALGFLSVVNGDQVNLQRKRRIIDGSRLDIAEANFMVQLMLKEGSVAEACSGSLIRADWILTAAHCVEGVQEENIKVIGNISKETDPHSVVGRVWRKHIGKLYRKSIKFMDLALLQLEAPMEGKYVDTIDYEDERITISKDYLIAFGFGVYNARHDSGKLHYKRIFPILNEACQSLKFKHLIDRSRLCTIVDSCDSGDSGGPIVHIDKVVGIISEQMTREHMCIGIHTRVQHFASWIRHIMTSAGGPPVMQI